MKEPHDVVNGGRHWPAGGYGVAVRHGNGCLLVGAEDGLGSGVAAVVHQRVVQAPEGGARVQGNVLIVQGLKDVYDDIRAVLRPSSPRRLFAAWPPWCLLG